MNDSPVYEYQLDPSRGRPPGLQTITEESKNDSFDSSVEKQSSYDAAKTPLSELNPVLNQQVMTVVIDTVIKILAANGLSLDSAQGGPNADVNSSQSAIQQLLAQSGELNRLENLFKGLTIDDQTQENDVNSEVPPIPPLPKGFTESSVSQGTKFQTDGPNISSNEYLNEDNTNLGVDFTKHDVNMNLSNPFNYSTYSSDLTPEPQSYESAYGYFSNNFDHPHTDSAAPSFAPQAPASCVYQNETTSTDSQQPQLRVPTTTPTPRKVFETSLEQSAVSFFERIEKTSQSKPRETNPFKADIESDTIHRTKVSPLESSSSPIISSKSPFASTDQMAQEHKAFPTKMAYVAAPVMYDLSDRKKTELKQESKPKLQQPEIKREALERVKRINVEDWLQQDSYANRNDLNTREPSETARDGSSTSTKTCEPYDFNNFMGSVNSSGFVNSRTSNVPPPIPPIPPRPLRLSVPSTESRVKSNDYTMPAKNLQGNSDQFNQDQARYSGLAPTQTTESVPNFELKESRTRGSESCVVSNQQNTAAAGSPTAVKVEKQGAAKRVETVKREETVSGEAAVKGKTELNLTVRNFNFQELQLTKQIVYLIHLDNEGWLTMEEFVSAFTTYKIPAVVLTILKVQNANIPFRFIQRSDYPKLFDELERTALAVPRNHNNRIGDTLHLVPIKSILKILRKLKILDLNEMELATKKKIFPKNSSALFDTYTVITIHANLQRDCSPS